MYSYKRNPTLNKTMCSLINVFLGFFSFSRGHKDCIKKKFHRYKSKTTWNPWNIHVWDVRCFFWTSTQYQKKKKATKYHAFFFLQRKKIMESLVSFTNILIFRWYNPFSYPTWKKYRTRGTPERGWEWGEWTILLANCQ